MAEFLSQDEIDALLDIADDNQSKEEKFYKCFKKELDGVLPFVLNILSEKFEIIEEKDFKNFLKNNTLNFFIENNFEIYTEANKKYKCSFIFPEEYQNFLVNKFTEVETINENDEELKDGCFEISEHIIGSFLTTLNSSGILNNVYLRETRTNQKIIEIENLSDKLLNYSSYSINILYLRIEDKEIPIFLIMDKTFFNDKIEKSYGFLNNKCFSLGKQKNYSYYDFKKPNRIDINSYKRFSLFFYEVSELIEKKFKENIFSNNEVKVKLYSIEQMLYEEFMYSVPQISNFNVLTSEYLQTKIITEINPAINDKIITSLLGIGSDSYKKHYNNNNFFYNEEKDVELQEIKNHIFKEFFNNMILEPLNENFNKKFKNINFENKLFSNDCDIRINEQNKFNDIVLCSIIEIEIDEVSGFLSFCFNINEVLPLLEKIYLSYQSLKEKISNDLINVSKESVSIIEKIMIKNKDLKENTKINIKNNKIKETLILDKILNTKDYFVNNVKINLGKKVIENLDDVDNIELNQKVNEPLEISIGNTSIRLGEAVLVEGVFGFKIKQMEDNFKEIIDDIENEYFVIKKDNKRYLSLKNFILFEINKDNVLINLEK